MSPIPSRLGSFPRSSVPMFLAGAVVGMVAGAVLVSVRWREVDGGAVRGIRKVMDRIELPDLVPEMGVRSSGKAAERIDLKEIRRLLRTRHGGADVRVNLLDPEVLEVVGGVGSDAEARAILKELARQPGVKVVLDRIWPPTSRG